MWFQTSLEVRKTTGNIELILKPKILTSEKTKKQGRKIGKFVIHV
jgi:hypothetical protein